MKVTVRARILAAVLLFTALGMAASGIAFVLFEQRQLLNHLDEELGSDVAEFRLRHKVTSPGTGVQALLVEALGRPAPTDEAIFGLVDGRLRYVPDVQQPLDLRSEPGLLAEVTALGPDEPARIRQSATSVGDVRWTAVQVTGGDGSGERGSYVVAVLLEPAQQRLSTSIRQYTALSGVALVFVGAGGWLVTGRLLRPLGQLRAATRRITSNDLASRIPVAGDDDISELTRSVNAMLDRLQSAFDAQQEFLDDAGHELRTPVTIVRGHLELMDARDPADVEAVRGLALDELDRMSRLVDDLIVLAQARRPDFVRFEPVDVDQLLHSAVGKASALADRHWIVDSCVGAVVLADEQRLTQAVLQLADNAAKHTAPGDVIAVGGAVVGRRVLLWVRDSGPGVAPQDAELIFERFGRAGSARGSRGSGLGLSIVAGIAAAHGGRAVLSSTSSPGACFTLELPLTVLVRPAPQPVAPPPVAPQPVAAVEAPALPAAPVPAAGGHAGRPLEPSR